METNQIVSNGEKFTKQIIMEFQLSSIIMVIFNMIKNCKFNKKIFKNISRNDYWNEYLDELGSTLRIEPAQLIRKISQNSEYINDVRGTYIHPKLVIFM